MERREIRRRALKAAFPYTVPIFASFWFIGLTYGVYMNVSGFSFVYPMLMSMTIYGGSLEFITVSMLLSPFAPVSCFFLALMVQARHLFYGISMLEKYRGLGWKRFFLIFGMCDESFSVNFSAQIPPDVDRGWFMLFVTALNWLYWVTGSTIGGLAGSLIGFSTEGMDFVLTALFVVILLEQLLKEKEHYSAFIGIGVSLLCLVIFGADSFLLPTMAGMLCLLTMFRGRIEKGCEPV